MTSSVLLLLGSALLGYAASPAYFVPSNRAPGIGASRDDISDELLNARADLMIQTQTFGILRDSRALAGARRVTSDRNLQSLFHSAAERSGFPVETLEAIAYLESWGEAAAQSPTGPRGIMQISLGTARVMGLAVKQSRRYRVVRERVQLASRGRKPKYRTIKRRIPYTVVSRDDRLKPERAIPAAAMYLASLERKLGGRDWAIFAYHCGPGCAERMLEITRNARGVRPDQVTVARMFFSANPAWNRELYQAIEEQMERDWSPTYWFRIVRAQQLLSLYRRDPVEFAAQAEAYRSDFSAARAPHRLAVWLRGNDMLFRTVADIRSDLGRKMLVRAFDRPEYFGYTVRLAGGADPDPFPGASPSAIGALIYIAFETRRLHEQLSPPGEVFQPLAVTSLVEPGDFAAQPGRAEAPTHASGQVFDIDYSTLPPGELECLRFVLDDLGWGGYLGFVEEGRKRLHAGCSPGARDFFAAIFEEASGFDLAD